MTADFDTAIEKAKGDMRREVDGQFTTVGVQIGALQQLFDAKLHALNWKIALALIGGQSVAGLVGGLVATHQQTARQAVSYLPFF